MNKHGGYYGDNQEGVIDFSVNINPLGVSEKVIKRINKSLREIVRYPEIDGSSSRGIIARNLGIEKTEIILGNGATELIYLYARTIKADKVLIIQPTFNEYERAFRISGSRIFNFLLSEEGGFQIDEAELICKIKEIKPDMLVICNPNNPTGIFVEYQKLTAVFDYMKKIGSYIFIDESFIDFTDEEDLLSLIDKYPVFILRSMTKFYAIPGIRLGYGLACEELIARLNDFKEPWTINSIALDIVSTLYEDKEYIANTKEWLSREKGFVKEELGKFKDIKVLNTYTNFHLCKIRNQKASELREKLLIDGIYIRTCEDFYGLGDSYFRIAVRTHADNLKLIKSLKHWL